MPIIEAHFMQQQLMLHISILKLKDLSISWTAMRKQNQNLQCMYDYHIANYEKIYKINAMQSKVMEYN